MECILKFESQTEDKGSGILGILAGLVSFSGSEKPRQ